MIERSNETPAGTGQTASSRVAAGDPSTLADVDDAEWMIQEGLVDL